MAQKHHGLNTNFHVRFAKKLYEYTRDKLIYNYYSKFRMYKAKPSSIKRWLRYYAAKSLRALAYIVFGYQGSGLRTNQKHNISFKGQATRLTRPSN